MKLKERDKKIIWHPFTQEKTAPLPIAIKSGKGSYLYDYNGKSYLDLISSWWCNLFGHCNEKIASAISKQVHTLEHVIFAGFTHEPAVKYCEMLQQILPEKLQRYFFSDNGSTTVETALKMALQYWRNIGQTQKKFFIVFEGGYHGDTFGCMSVSSSGFHKSFDDWCFQVLKLPFPKTWIDDENVEEKEIESLNLLETILGEHRDKIAGIIIEPLVQGASGMRMCRSNFLNKLLKRVKEEEILVIFDEVMTGFGRTGTNFAFEQLTSTPDILCLSKGITGGFLPLALTVTTQKLYEAFLNDDWSYALAHGHTYSANPTACSAAIATMELFNHPSTVNKIKAINESHQKGIELLKDKRNIQHIRITGTICAFETTDNVNNSDLSQNFLEKGLLLRPLGKVFYLIPPYSVTTEELTYTYEVISDLIKKV